MMCHSGNIFCRLAQLKSSNYPVQPQNVPIFDSTAYIISVWLMHCLYVQLNLVFGTLWIATQELGNKNFISPHSSGDSSLDLLRETFLLVMQATYINGKWQVLTGFKLAIRKWFRLFTDHFKQFFLWNLGIKTFLLLEFLFSGKPQSFCLHFKLDIIFLHLDSILVRNTRPGELTELPHNP